VTSAKTGGAYPGLDVAKFLMALLVVEIHTNPFMVGEPGLATDVIRGIDCVAVPFFFIASGFLCFRKVDLDGFASAGSASASRVKDTALRQLRMYLAWTALYLPITIWADVAAGNGPIKSALLFVRGTLLIGENQYSWPLWYLLASVVAFALVYLMLRGGVPLMRVLAASTAALLVGLGSVVNVGVNP
jgi:peptidoglycan/LPS O-acetylase OafA/YrhL